MGLKVQGLGFRVLGSRFRVQLGFGFQGFEFCGFEVWGLRLGILGFLWFGV